MRSDALRGHLDSLILAALEDGPRHGYAITEALLARTGGEVDVPTGTLYPALRRLERAGYLRGEWSTVAGRERRTYRLTPSGRRVLAAQRHEWQAFADVISRALRPATDAE
jgi:PadR family transcriptional regulator